MAALVGTLRATSGTGRTGPLAWRRAQLTRLRALLTENRSATAAALHKDLRKSRAETDGAEIGATLREIDDLLEHLHTWTARQPVAVPASLPEGTDAHTVLESLGVGVLEPLGVGLANSAWKYPINLLLVPVAGALAAGNAVVAKPSECAAATSALLAALLPHHLDRITAPRLRPHGRRRADRPRRPVHRADRPGRRRTAFTDGDATRRRPTPHSANRKH
ncbi:aldehyde dehydrogenase family protein [Streptomyces sp. WP-1]|uniref:aldehyde dehydrogenase family protein n=1 Tax=Streptomyces sp. WP-1 TaxID=3041497 RepID=UPI00264A0CE1|nr:aldehyde dehydrogenase family protein [Streptomyces sp. WP-1]WKE73562.1 aldehyde dehydrogenase family protein [Streptomyces sp. WP-1]